MRIIEPSFEILETKTPTEILANIEKFGRVCYKSEDKITEKSADKFIRQLIERKHESVLEHEKLTIRIICDRGISHELVRHRIASYSQESTRYCNYSKEKFGNELTFIKPPFWSEDSTEFNFWKETMLNCEQIYMKLIEMNTPPEQARTILPNSLKTEIIITMNFREWRHFFKLRTSAQAHPQMKEITIPLLKILRQLYEPIFFDIELNLLKHFYVNT